MTTRAHEAADAIKRAAKMYEQFVTAAEILDKIGSLDQAAAEANAAREKHEAARDAALAEMVKAQEAAKSTRSDIDEQLRLASEREQKIISKAEFAADEIIRAAQERADALVVTASTDVERIANEGRVANANLAENAARLAEDVATLDALIVERRAMASDAEARLEAAREQMRKMLGS